MSPDSHHNPAPHRRELSFRLSASCRQLTVLHYKFGKPASWASKGPLHGEIPLDLVDAAWIPWRWREGKPPTRAEQIPGISGLWLAGWYPGHVSDYMRPVLADRGLITSDVTAPHHQLIDPGQHPIPIRKVAKRDGSCWE